MPELTRALCKAARGLAEWSIKDLSENSGLSLDTLRSFESGRTKRLSRENEAGAVACFEQQGIQFLEEGDTADGSGVVLVQADE